MREIEGIENVIAKLKPHWDEIDAHFAMENARFIRLRGQSHDVLGRLLKCHLILENYLDRFLEEHLAISSIEEAKLGFFNKAMLLPSKGAPAAFIRPGVIQLNRLRNRFGHQLDAALTMSHLGAITEILQIARRETKFKEPILAIEAFTTIACTWLIIPPKRIQSIFAEAFKEVHVTGQRNR